MCCTPAVVPFTVKGTGPQTELRLSKKWDKLANGNDGATGTRTDARTNDKHSNSHAGFLAAPVGLLRNPPLDGYLSRPRWLVL